MENKQEICNLLCKALQATRNQYDLKALIYDEEHEIVTVAYSEGGNTVNVACDSGIAMMRDILNSMR